MIRFIRRRWRSFAGLLPLVLVALAVGVSQVLAGTGTATVPIEKNNSTCGTSIGTSAIGSVTYTRDDKTTLREHVRLTKATPSKTYYFYLYSGSGVCNFLTTLGTVKTDSSGAGEATFTSSTYGYQTFWIWTWDGSVLDVYGEAPPVKVDG
jgi:hypothetical protein